MKNAETKKMREEIKKHLTEGIILSGKGCGMTSSAVITVFWTTI